MRTSRKVLRLLCVLGLGGGAALLALGLRVSLAAHLGASAAALAGLGACVLLLSTLGFVAAGVSKSGPLMLYFFLNFFLATGLLISCCAAFFFRDALESWLKHHWSSDILTALRNEACCTSYEATVTYLEHRVAILGAVGLGCMLVVLASLYCVIRIVTVPIVMRSMLSVMNAVFVALGAGLVIYGFSVKLHDEMASGQQWLALVFIIVGTLIVALAVLGVIGSRAKSRTLLLLYVVGLAGCLVALLVCAVSAFSFSGRLAATYNAHASASLACDIELPGCSNCSTVASEVESCDGVTQDSDGYWISCSASTSNTTDCQEDMTVLNAKADQGYEPNDIATCGQCPEWSAADVQAFLRGSLRLLGLLAVVVCFFMVVGFIGALVLRRSLAGYQTDSI